jgi:hypothetical protein
MQMQNTENPVYQIHGRNPPKDFTPIGHCGVTLIEGADAIVTADGTRH